MHKMGFNLVLTNSVMLGLPFVTFGNFGAFLANCGVVVRNELSRRVIVVVFAVCIGFVALDC